MAANDPMQAMLDQLCRGDADAAERAFITYEPFLRMVVRRQLSAALRVKFDSIDVVQSVWADLLHGFRAGTWNFDTPDHLRAFLVRATRNRFIDRVRREKLALQCEQHVPNDMLGDIPQRTATSAGDSIMADELWAKLLTLCPPQHHELLRLKRLGLPLATIAAQTGLHESSVRRILYELAERLATSNLP